MQRSITLTISVPIAIILEIIISATPFRMGVTDRQAIILAIILPYELFIGYRYFFMIIVDM